MLNKLCVFYSELDDPKSQKLGNELLFRAFDEKKADIFNDNPFSFALKLVINTNALDDPHIKSIPYKIIMGLNDFVRQQDENQQSVMHCMITDFIKAVAFEISHKHLTFFRVMTAVFLLKTSCGQIITRLKTMLEAKDYKTVARIIDTMGYWNEFGPEEIMIPLIFRDALQVAEDLLVRMNTQRKYETLMLIDSFLKTEGACDNACVKFAQEHTIPGIKIVKLAAKPLMKTIKKLLGLCGVMVDELPNMNKIVTRDRLCAILLHRYANQTANPIHSDNAIKELVKEGAKDLQEIVVEYCVQYGHYTEAQKWCQYWQLPESRYLSETRKDEIEKTKQDLDKNHNTTDKVNFPPFLINSTVKIFSVHDLSGFDRMCSAFDRVKFVSIDVEGDSRSTSAALIQISTTTYIYIIDVIVLESERFDEGEWAKLKSSLFDNPKILKLGFNWDADVSMLDRTFHWNLDLTNGSYLDVQKVWVSLCEKPKFKLPHQYEKGDNRKHQDLKTFVEHCTGTTLDKSVKRIDFAIRPLSERMINYAAKDANSLLQAYFVFKREARNCGVDVDTMTLN